MHVSTALGLSLLVISASAAPPHLEARKGAAPVGGPASAKVTIYSNYVCTAPGIAPPTDGSAGTATSFTIAEATCTIPTAQLIFGGAVTATLSTTPKTGTVGCAYLFSLFPGALLIGDRLYSWT
ncbi:hypothetical protein E4T49_00012 [Aureobasidium sp. EXF-10728]|nr:hypothetical protein E4T49_00012 [Aureobasidium sp. EXF-10728]